MSGGFKRGFGEYGGSEGQMWKPQEVRVDAQGRVYVTESAWHTIYVYDSYGTDLASTYLGKIQDPSLTSPIGMTIGGSNRLFAVSLVARKIYVYRILDGTPGAYIVGTPVTHDFGIAYVGESSENRTFDIFNIGGGELVIDASTFTGANPSEFSIQSDNCSNHFIAPSASCAINAALTPLSSGEKSAILSIPNNDPDDDPFEISLSGLANIVPSAIPNGPFLITEGEAIDLDASGSIDPDGNIVSYEWDIDNNGIYDYISTSPTQSHTYVQNATYIIKLRVTDDLGASAVATTMALVADTGPTADFTAYPTYGSAPLTVNFNNNSTGYDQPLFYEWDFDINDGNSNPDSYDKDPTYVYNNTGSYTVTLKVTDSDGSTDTKVDYVTVTLPYTLTVYITGSGTVTSSPTGIDCGTDCTEQYSEGTVVNLTAEPVDAGSTFAGWTGSGCSETVGCNVSINEDTDVTAAFDICPNLPVRISGATTVYYSTIQEAYEAAEGGQTIQSQAVALEADLNLEKPVTLDGGYNCEYTTNTGMTRLIGTITISNGTVTIGNLIIE
jgi:PKD repeat protein